MMIISAARAVAGSRGICVHACGAEIKEAAEILSENEFAKGLGSARFCRGENTSLANRGGGNCHLSRMRHLIACYVYSREQ